MNIVDAMTTTAFPGTKPAITRRARRRGSVASRPPAGDIPELHNGDRLTQAEVHRRYEAMPAGIKAELIGGMVHTPSPTRMPHKRSHGLLAGVLVLYEEATPGTEMAGEGTVILGSGSEPEPDLQLRLLPEYGGRSRVNDEGYLVGPPELLIEVAHSSEAIDLHAK